MNFLAHLYLAEDTDESILGNLLGDFVKGSPSGLYSDEIVKGIMTHRNVDKFTDSHAITKESKLLFSLPRRRYAGIIIDVTNDHYLSKHWSQFSDKDLDNFIHDVYRTLERHQQILPPSLARIIPFMIEDDWLGSYSKLGGVSNALGGISRRFARKFNRDIELAGAIEEVEANYLELEEAFLNFFPELIDFTKQYRKSYDHNPHTS